MSRGDVYVFVGLALVIGVAAAYFLLPPRDVHATITVPEDEITVNGKPTNKYF